MEDAPQFAFDRGQGMCLAMQQMLLGKKTTQMNQVGAFSPAVSSPLCSPTPHPSFMPLLPPPLSPRLLDVPWPADVQSRRGHHRAPLGRPVSLKIGHQIRIQFFEMPPHPLVHKNGPLIFGSLFKIPFSPQRKVFWFWVGGWLGLGWVGPPDHPPPPPAHPCPPSVPQVPAQASARSWWDLNGFEDHALKIIVTCRDTEVHKYGQCLGPQPMRLYLHGFGPQQMREYVERRLQAQGTAAPPPVALRSRWDDPPSRVAGADEAAAAPTAALAEDAARGPALSTPPANEMTDVQLEAGRLVTQMQGSCIGDDAFSVPFVLNMGIDLYLSDVVYYRSADLGAYRRSQLYDKWFRQRFAAQGVDADVGLSHAQELAWDLYKRGITHDHVGKWGSHDWFRRCPLRVHDYQPDSFFSFQHKSLQEYLVAYYLWDRLEDGSACGALEAVDVTHDVQVLRFFGNIYAVAEEVLLQLLGVDIDAQMQLPCPQIITQIARHRKSSSGCLCSIRMVRCLGWVSAVACPCGRGKHRPIREKRV